MREIDETKNKPLNEKDAIRSIKFIDRVFKENNIPYWVDYGTLLGAIRDKKFIPWDTDIEFYMFYKKDEDRLRIIEAIKKEGLKFSVDMSVRQGVTFKHNDGYIHMGFGWFRRTIGTTILSKICYHLPKFIRKWFMDFTHRHYSNSKREFIRPYSGKKRESHKISCMVRSWLPIFFCGKLKEVPFYDFKISVPGKAEDLLYFRYGKDWKTPKKVYESYTV